ncbi:MAG: hypothetical protein ACO3VS_05385 [Limisphaerales bacterium]
MHSVHFTQLHHRSLRHFVDTTGCSLRITVLCLSGLVITGLFGAESTPLRAPERVAPLSLYSPSLSRFGGSRAMDIKPINRATYMAWIDASGELDRAKTPKLGLRGPDLFTPILAKYVQTGEPFWGEAILGMLHDFDRALQEEIERTGACNPEPGYILLYRKHLIEGGLMREEDAWFKEMWTRFCRYQRPWGGEVSEWRGSCHRSSPEGLAKGMAAKWYPDLPEAPRWRTYAAHVWNDFWLHKETPQNDTGYYFGTFIHWAYAGDQYHGDFRLITDPGMQRLWERMLLELSPDGAINPYGPSGGWNSTADVRLYLMELVAAKTGDGRYRFAAHRLANYMDFINQRSIRYAALAWLVADDSIKPVEPEAGSLWTQRIEAIRIPHRDPDIIGRWLEDPDPHPIRGHVCCSWILTGKPWPDKLILRSGWEPGDFFGLVELHPTSFPANPGGIMGLNRWGSAYTQVVSSKGDSPENRLWIRDVKGTTQRRIHPDPLRIDEQWKTGVMPDIRSKVTHFEDHPEVTFARVEVAHMDGLPVTYSREFIFVKNQYLATREILHFEETFQVQAGPIWNTQNIGPQIGDHWANTFMGAAAGGNGTYDVPLPASDLLVWFAPREDCQLQLVSRFEEDPRTRGVPVQLRYAWEGHAQAGEKQVFTQVYLPHRPYRTMPATTTNPQAKGTAPTYANPIEATAGASTIQVLRDDPTATVLNIQVNPERTDLLVFHPEATPLEMDGKTYGKAFHWIPSANIEP